MQVLELFSCLSLLKTVRLPRKKLQNPTKKIADLFIPEGKSDTKLVRDFD